MRARKLCALVSAALIVLGPLAAYAQPPIGAYGPTGVAPIPLYAGLLGSYSKSLTSGTMAAGLGAAAPIFSFRYAPTITSSVAVIRSVQMAVSGTATAFAAGNGVINMFPARAFTASDTGGTAGTITGNNGKMRTSFATTGVGDIRISSTATLTAGTRTLDTDPLATINFSVGTGTSTQFVQSGTALYLPTPNEYPLVVANNEGFVLQATVPATGTWITTVTVTWDEYTAF